MNFRKGHKSLEHSEVNLTPLVDVVLQLVLFFMVTAQFAVLPGLKLTLPTVAPEAVAQTSERLEITMTSQNDLFFEGQPTTLKDLPALLERTGAAGPEVVILISADQDAPYGRIVRIMDILRQNGWSRVVFAARPQSEEEPAERPGIGE